MSSSIDSMSPARAPAATPARSVATAFRCIAIPTGVADAVRETLVAPGYPHPAHVEMATGYGPCRHCLRTFEVGIDRRILFTYDPFDGLERLPLPGPIFIHAESCPRHPEDDGFPDDLRVHPLTLEAYAAGRRLLAQEYVTDGDVEAALERLFASSATGYVHVRDTAAGCYDLRVERADRIDDGARTAPHH